MTYLNTRRDRLLTVGAFVLALALLATAVLFAAGPQREAGAAKPKPAVWLGGTSAIPNPLCPGSCQVIPRVSGIQTMLPTGEEPYRASADGDITAWRIYLGKPNNKDRSDLNQRFGSPPKAAITILQRIRTPEGRTKYRLQRKSGVKALTRELGGLATFRLAKPLPIKKGQYVALAVPTWAPAFAAGLTGSQYSWQASRQPGLCGTGSVDQASAQLKVGSKRLYSCSYSGSRLLFTAKLRLR